jgi:hypothetical protein
MDNSCGQENPFANPERGTSRLKFILILAIIAAIAYVGYQYVPVAYQASRFKVTMQDTVDKAAALGQSNDWLRSQLRMDANEYNIPPDAEITIERSGEGRFQARVQYKRAVVFPGYTYSYEFDHTAKSTQLLGSKQ